MAKHRRRNLTNQEPVKEDPNSVADSSATNPDKGQSEQAKISLPPVETLHAKSDFTPFLKEGVPSLLKRAALRKLWKSDPTLANLDGLNDYDEDFVKMSIGKVVKTAYTISQKFIETKEELTSKKSEETDTALTEKASDESNAQEANEPNPEHQRIADGEPS